MPSFEGVLKELEQWGSYENTARPRDISRLEGISQLLQELGNPHHDLRVIHIAGTNGKGLTALMLGKLILAEGDSCGIYSSPHLTDIRERIIINGKLILKKDFTQFASKALDIANSFHGEPYLSYFDLLTSIALLAFQKTGMHWVILETGLGGKADSTNITEKELCILTPIGMDHQEVLGDSIFQIASEKLGITRSGIPTVMSKQKESLKNWMRLKLRKSSVPFLEADTEIVMTKNGSGNLKEGSSDTWNLKWCDGTQLEITGHPGFSLPWLESLRTAMTAYENLYPKAVTLRKDRLEILESVRLPARLELRKNVTWRGHHFNTLILDGGHNADALDALAFQLEEWRMRECTLILGMSRDKLDLELVPALKKVLHFSGFLITCPFDSPRSADAKELLGFLNSEMDPQELPIQETTDNIEEALMRATKFSDKPLVIMGSFYLAGEVLLLLEG